MAIVNIDETVYGWLSRIWCIVVCLFAFATLANHTHQIRQALSKNKLSWTNSLTWSIILHLLVINLNGIWFMWVSFGTFNDLPTCQIVVMGATLGYVFVKFSLYMILSFRLGMFNVVYTINRVNFLNSALSN